MDYRVTKAVFFLTPSTGKENRPMDKFQLTFPLRTNYMYAKAKRSSTLPEMYSFTVCLWIKSNASPGVGTPFSYAVPGQPNEVVLIEWGDNPMEFLINDKVTDRRFKTHPFRYAFCVRGSAAFRRTGASRLTFWMCVAPG